MAVELSKRWWDKNKPDALKKKSELDKVIARYDKQVREPAAKKWQGADKGMQDVPKVLAEVKKALEKDLAAVKKAKDKKGEKLLNEALKDIGSKTSSFKTVLKPGPVDVSTASNGGSGSPPSAATADAGASAPMAAVKEIANAANAAWGIMKDGKATLTTGAKYCEAIPKGGKFTDFSGWKTFAGAHKMSQKNGFGVTVIDIELTVSFQHHGTSLGTGGFFLGNFTIYAKKATVLWGWSADINASVSGKPFNSGKPAFPVGAIPLSLSVSMGSMLNTSTHGWKYTAHGDGKLECA